jgi:threonine synthase
VVSKRDIHAVLSQAWGDKGWWVCPEGAAWLAALLGGLVKAGDEEVAFNTGSLEKHLPKLRHLL